MPYIPDPVFPKNSNPDPNSKNVAGLKIRAYLCHLPGTIEAVLKEFFYLSQSFSFAFIVLDFQ